MGITLRLRFLFFDRQGRGVLHTPHQTSPSRGRMRVPGYFAGQFIGVVRALPCPIRGRMQYAPTLTVDCMGSFCQSSDLDAPSDVPDKGTNAGTRLFRRVICWGRPGPIVPVCGAYAVAPYISGSCFLTVRVGAYCIRSIRRPRQGDECGCPVISQGDLFGSPGPYRARLWGVFNTPLPCRSIVFIRMGRGVLNTPHQTSPTRGRMRVPSYFAGQSIGGIRALPCPFVGRMLLRPYPAGRLYGVILPTVRP